MRIATILPSKISGHLRNEFKYRRCQGQTLWLNKLVNGEKMYKALFALRDKAPIFPYPKQ